MKNCNKCGLEKETYQFPIRKDSKDGYRNTCNECHRKYQKSYNRIYIIKNKEKIAIRVKRWRDENPELIEKYKDVAKSYQEKNKESIKDYTKRYRRKNQEKTKENQRKWYKKNSKKINKQRRSSYEINKIKINKQLKDRRNIDCLYKLKTSVRSRIKCFLHSKNLIKRGKTFDIVGCSPEELKEYLEKQFTEGMTWGNYGFYGWHIDHRIPLDSGKTEEEIYKLCHYTNLQPLWAIENFKKWKKIL